jgi:hypothetical protein
MELARLTYLLFIMEPISRKELQEAKAAAIESARLHAIRAEEIKGQLWAERMRTLVCRAATDGYMDYESDISGLSAVAYTHAFETLKQMFPDSDVEPLVYNDATKTKTIKIWWG